MGRPLGYIERAAALTDQAAPFNTVAVMTLDGPIEAEDVRSALARIVERYPAASMTPVDGRFEPCGVVAAELTVTEGGRPAVDAEIDFLLNDRPADRGAHPLRARIVHGEAGDTVLLAAPHCLVDATALARLAFETLGEEAPSPPAPSDASIEERFPPEFKGAAGSRRLALYVAGQLAGETAVRLGRLGTPRPPTPPPGATRHAMRRLDQELVARLAARCRTEGCTMSGLLAAVAGQVFVDLLLHRDAAPVRIMTFRDLRRRVVPTVPPGEISACFSTARLNLWVAGPSVWPNARTFSRTLAERGRRGDPFLANLVAPKLIETLIRRHARAADVAINLPVFGRPGEAVAKRLRFIEGYVSVLPFAPPISFVAAAAREGLAIAFTYLDSEFDAARMREITDAFVTRLERLR